jgi:methionyl-tRNA formyltransferase
MKIIICNSKNWFSADKEIYTNHTITEITKKDELTEEFLDHLNPDYIFFTHWNWIVPKQIHNKFLCIVFHTAPLPYGRGGSPIQNLILKGLDSSPVCALKMTEELDAGPIYSKIEISLKGSLKEIFSRVNDAVNKLITEITKNKITPVEQSGEPTLFNRLKNNALPKDIELNQIYDRVRMLDHNDYPNSYIIHGRNKFEFFDAEHENGFINLKCKISKYQ